MEDEAETREIGVKKSPALEAAWGKRDPNEPEKTAMPHWTSGDERIVDTCEIKKGMNDRMEERENVKRKEEREKKKGERKPTEQLVGYCPEYLL